MYIVIYHGCRVVMLRWRVTEKSAFHSGNIPYNIWMELTIALCAALVIFATLCTMSLCTWRWPFCCLLQKCTFEQLTHALWRGFLKSGPNTTTAISHEQGDGFWFSGSAAGSACMSQHRLCTYQGNHEASLHVETWVKFIILTKALEALVDTHTQYT